ncbi:MAG TPA: ABC transporter ATP-binding protein [Salinivirga sp.]|uniref:ABC transporter ATP-binding protein n=1 Tax=Salinivirga sp. TaxID=1970192 RepID=UPI002B47BD4C|nr:ABC transporter ATP-binding protein [Salinivirga sp.]HKK59081.1 ABC transporter ATP-binding protein [Salinivirga sp.]
MIKVEKLNKYYGDLHVLRDVDLYIKQGEIVTIVGPSGAGKTTLLQILGTLDRADSGAVWFDEQNPFELKQQGLSRFRNDNIGFVFQFHQLLPEFSALENISIPALIKGQNMKTAQDNAQKLLEKMGLTDRANHKPSELSGGEQQRVAVARALMNRPKVILADEPSGNLDTANKESLHKLFFSLRDEFNLTFIIVTHDKELAGLADRIVELRDGAIINRQPAQSGAKPEE